MLALVAAALLCSLAVPAFAEKNAALEAKLVPPGKVLHEDDFARDELGDEYRVAKGSWTVKDGTLVGKELKADEHAAVVGFGKPFSEGIVQFSFKLNGAKAMHLSLNDRDGHLFRAIVTPDGVVFRTDKDKKDPKSKSEVLGRSKKPFKPSEWYTLQLETFGPTAVLTVDDGVQFRVTHAGIGGQKTGYRIVTRGEGLQLDDIVIVSAGKPERKPF